MGKRLVGSMCAISVVCRYGSYKCFSSNISASAMGRYQRRGYVGQTNVPSPHKHESHNQRPRGPPLMLADIDHKTSPNPKTHLTSTTRKRQLRAKWRLDLAPIPRAIAPLTKPHADSPEAALAIGIEATQHSCKSYKDEPWYRSPIGAGSKSSVLLVALKQHDTKDTGFIPRDRVLQTLQERQFDLSEPQIQQLLRKYDPTNTQEQIHYTTFVRQLHFTDTISTQPDEHDIIFRHHRYLEKIRDHATHLMELSEAAATGSPKRLSPLRRVQESVANCEPSIVVGTSPVRFHGDDSGGSVSPSKLPLPCEDNPLSFENDKYRKHQRARAKATVLLSHIARIDEYARQEDVKAKQSDNLRIATKAIHHGEHLARIFDDQHRHLHRLENQGKGLLQSPSTKQQRSVSQDSMFYVTDQSPYRK